MATAPGSFVGQTFINNNILYTWDGEKWTGALRNSDFPIVGEIKVWPTPTPPSGYFLCNGAAISRTTYNQLFSILSTNYGAGDGSTTFNLPDFTDRFPIGAGNLYGINYSGGNKDDTYVLYHRHSYSITTNANNLNHSHSISTNGSHNHAMSPNTLFYLVETDPTPNDDPYTGGSDNTYFAKNIQSVTSTNGAHQHTIGTHSNSHSHSFSGTTSQDGVTGTDRNMPPYISMYFIIKY
jgi:microcystin-dependent protein